MAPGWQPLVAAALCAALLGAACSHSVSTLQEEPAPPEIGAVVIGAVVADDDDHQREVRRFRRELAGHLQESEAFNRVLSVMPAKLPANAVVVTGHIHRIGDGSETLRFTVGYGAGAPRMRVRLHIHDVHGVRLAAFSQSARSFDGTGYSAHWDPVYLDDLVDDLAERSANAIVRWSQGETIEPGFWESLL